MSSFKKLAIFLSISLFFASVSGQQLDILSSNEISQNESFTVTCDARRVTLPLDTNITSCIAISRQVGSGSGSVIAIDCPFGYFHGEFKEIKNIPFGRRWDITFTGGELVDNANQDRMRAVLRVNDSKCQDTGMYGCYVEYLVDDSFDVIEERQNLTVKALIENHLLTAVPHNGNDLLYSLYPLGSSVTLTCRIQGPAGLTMTWQQQLATDQGFYDYAAMNDIVTKDPEPVPGSTECMQLQYESTLKLVIEEPNPPTTSYPAMYQCLVKQNNTDVSKANITLGIDTTTSTDPAPESGTGVEDHTVVAYPLSCPSHQYTYPNGSEVTLTCRFQAPSSTEISWVVSKGDIRNFPKTHKTNWAEDCADKSESSCFRKDFESNITVVVSDPNLFPNKIVCIANGTSPISTREITIDMGDQCKSRATSVYSSFFLILSVFLCFFPLTRCFKTKV